MASVAAAAGSLRRGFSNHRRIAALLAWQIGQAKFAVEFSTRDAPLFA
jgi:hypothetical protein